MAHSYIISSSSREGCAFGFVLYQNCFSRLGFRDLLRNNNESLPSFTNLDLGRLFSDDGAQIDHFLASNLRRLQTGSGFSSASGLTDIFGAPAAISGPSHSSRMITVTPHRPSGTCKKGFTPRGIFSFAGWPKKTPAQFFTDSRLGSRNGPPAPLGPRAPRLLFSLVDLGSKSLPNALTKGLQIDSVSTRRASGLPVSSVLHTYHNVGLVHHDGAEQKPFQRDQDQITSSNFSFLDTGWEPRLEPGRGHCSGGKRRFFVDCHFRAGSLFVVKATTKTDEKQRTTICFFLHRL